MLLLYDPFSTKKMDWVHHNNTMIENLPLRIGPLLKFWTKKKILGIRTVREVMSTEFI